MRIIKLHTTDSTNNYLKEWIRINKPESFMIVVAEEQTQGRGQMGNTWTSEAGKNLIFSMFIKIEGFLIERQFQLNQAISLAIIKVLKKYLPQVQIKWPNDIMADQKKIAGILFENTLQNSQIKHSIVGVGLNVNQISFPKELSNASSLQLLCQKEFDRDKLLEELAHAIKEEILLLESRSKEELEKLYLQNLYLFKKTATFLTPDNKKLKGKIVGVAQSQVLIERTSDKKVFAFGFKELVFV